MQESQQDAQEEFTSALEALSSLTNFSGGDLEDMYNKINDKYQDSEKAAKMWVTESLRLKMSDALFEEVASRTRPLRSDSLKSIEWTKTAWN